MIDEKNWFEYFECVCALKNLGTEHSFRAPLEKIIKSFTADKKITIINEPKRISGFGAPDFRFEKDGLILGYIETKNLFENLDKTLKSEQIKRYANVIDNFLLTNFSEFILISKNEIVERRRLFYPSDLDKLKFKLDESNISAVNKLLHNFFLSSPRKITDSKRLAFALAERGKILQEYVNDILSEGSEKGFEGKINGLFKTFKQTLIEDLRSDGFADAYSQTVIYGFFLAFLQSGKKIAVEDASKYISRSFEIIREFFYIINDSTAPAHMRWIFQEIVDVINNIDLKELEKSLSYKYAEDVETDPYLYFYETFLGAFDSEKRKARGVYYTPLPVVKFIIESIDEILEDDFAKQSGFIEPSVTALDFATGTGTFLAFIFRMIFDKLKKSGGLTKSVISEHLLRNFYGFEYMVAPYAVAHLKLSQLLKAQNYELKSNERLQIYLTDTLNNSEHKSNFLLPALTEEGKKANKIKDSLPLLVITGNPPYNNRPVTSNTFIKNLIEDYKPADEKKINLDDDYIKFIRFAQWKLERVKQGVIGIITNNSFLNGLTHRRMREKLLADFDEIYILNLHGSARLNEAAPDGSTDENVFDIMQGVSINLFIKKNTKEKKCKVFYYDLFGKRDDKFAFLMKNNIKKMRKLWVKLDIDGFNKKFKTCRWGAKRFAGDLNFFAPLKNEYIVEYGNFWGLTEIFKYFSSGIKTDRDDLLIDFNENDLTKKMETAFSGEFDNEFRRKYNIKNSSSYAFEDKLKTQKFEKKNITGIQYRPFDFRKIYYKRGFTSRPAFEIMKHFLTEENVGISFIRNDYGATNFNYFLVSKKLIDAHLLGGNAYFAPLYIYSQNDQYDLFQNGKNERFINFTKEFKNFIDCRYSIKPKPMQILGYIYAVMYSDIYRAKYTELLKIDYPRIPFTDDEIKFKKLSKLGEELIECHLFDKLPKNENINFCQTTAKHNKNDTVEKVEFVKGKKCLIFINEFQYFENISEEAFNYTIGGYEVLNRWLKSRIGRRLSYEEKFEFINICGIINSTIIQIQKINSVIGDV